MRLTWTPAQDKIRARYQEFARDRVAPGSRWRDQHDEFDMSAWQALADSDFWRVPVPVELGGLGGDLWDHLAAFEGLASGAEDCGFVLTCAAHAGLIQLLLKFGTAHQRAHLLPGLLSGQVGATAATEASGGSHVGAVATRAIPTSGGYRLNGEKVHITNAPVADIMMVVGRVEGIGQRDITLFLLTADDPGLMRGENEKLLGLRTSPLGSLTIRDVELGADRVLGPVGDGLATLYWCLAFDRLLYGIIVAAHLEALIPMAMRRAQHRAAFGKPLADHQYIQGKLVDIQIAVESSRALSYVAADAFQRSDERASMVASVSKLVSGDGIVHAALDLVQIFGHLGCDREFPVERQLRDSIAFRIAGGTNEMQRKNIFARMLHLHTAPRAYLVAS